MFSTFLPKSKIFYLNDRHEEADTHREDRRKLYDKRILPLLGESDFAIFAEKIDPFLWNYYRSLDLAKIKPKNIFYADSYLEYPSLTTAILANEALIKKLKQKKFHLVIPYIESWNTGKLAERINAFLLREVSFTNWINNKSNYRQVLTELKLPVIPGYRTNQRKSDKHFQTLKKQGFRKVVFKRERSVSGFGTFVVEENDFQKCLNYNFQEDENFVLEGFIEDIKYSPNLQYFIPVMGESINFVTATDQLLEKDNVSYSGNIYPLFLSKRIEISKTIEEMSQKICYYLQSKRCFGLVGIDYIITKKGDVYSTEANVRLNGSTFPALIVERLFGKNPSVHWLFKTFHFNKPISFEKLFHKFKYFIKEKGGYGVLPVGVDLMDSLGEGQFMVIAENHNKLYDLYNKFLGLCSR